MLVCLMQTENEAAMQQMKRLRLEHAHSLQHLAEENARLQRTLAHIQVLHQSHCATLCSCGRCHPLVLRGPTQLHFAHFDDHMRKGRSSLQCCCPAYFTYAATIDPLLSLFTRMTYLLCTLDIVSRRIPYPLDMLGMYTLCSAPALPQEHGVPARAEGADKLAAILRLESELEAVREHAAQHEAELKEELQRARRDKQEAEAKLGGLDLKQMEVGSTPSPPDPKPPVL